MSWFHCSREARLPLRAPRTATSICGTSRLNDLNSKPLYVSLFYCSREAHSPLRVNSKSASLLFSVTCSQQRVHPRMKCSEQQTSPNPNPNPKMCMLCCFLVHLFPGGTLAASGSEGVNPNLNMFVFGLTRVHPGMNVARLSHLPFGVPVRAFILLMKRPSG